MSLNLVCRFAEQRRADVEQSSACMIGTRSSGQRKRRRSSGGTGRSVPEYQPSDSGRQSACSFSSTVCGCPAPTFCVVVAGTALEPCPLSPSRRRRAPDPQRPCASTANTPPFSGVEPRLSRVGQNRMAAGVFDPQPRRQSPRVFSDACGNVTTPVGWPQSQLVGETSTGSPP